MCLFIYQMPQKFQPLMLEQLDFPLNFFFRMFFVFPALPSI
ncbi:hypothetical protein LINPERHAP1_LOCUS6927 [Linum perenne]